jgi:ssDNA-binding Zn-finger/Zn-ribbon topoisomerase 1
MFQKMGDGLRRFFSGRYGTDRLNQTLLIGSVALLLLGTLGGKYLASWLSVFNVLAYVPLVWCMVRMFSRNMEARRRENAAFLRFFSRLRDKEYRYFRCPKCRQTVRVPRGKGKISISLPQVRRALHPQHIKNRAAFAARFFCPSAGSGPAVSRKRARPPAPFPAVSAPECGNFPGWRGTGS